MSVAGQLYPEPHLRPMRDIDLLVTPDAVPTIEAALRELGYHQESNLSREFYDAHHHTTPFHDPRTGVWVEVHRALCPAWSPVASDALFGLERIRAEENPAEFRGHAVYRLSEELQLVYLAAHWAYDFRLASGLVTMFDTIYLLGSTRSLRWECILSWLENAVAATPVYLLLSYLDRHELVRLPPGLLDELARLQRSFGRASLRLLHAMIDRYVVDGRQLGWVVSERNFTILWQSLLLPCPEIHKLLVIMKRLLPSRERLMRWRAEPSAAPTVGRPSRRAAASNASSSVARARSACRSLSSQTARA